MLRDLVVACMLLVCMVTYVIAIKNNKDDKE